MRKHSSQSNTISYQDDKHTIIIAAENHHFENNSASVNNSTHTSPGNLTLTTSAAFTSCVWRKCEAQNGGGIYLIAGSDVSLTVTKGEFYSCRANPYRGGGIYVQGIGKVCIKESFFHACIADAANDAGGGGIQLFNVQEPPNFAETSFISCESGNDGGGLGIWDSPFYQETCVLECRFIACIGNNPSSSGGGGMIVWSSNAAIGCSACIFVSCYGAQIGGGICYHTVSSSSFTDTALSSFCFFKENSSPCGNDAYFEGWIPMPPFLYCFSTTQDSHINPSGYEDWLPLTTVSLLLSQSLSPLHFSIPLK